MLVKTCTVSNQQAGEKELGNEASCVGGQPWDPTLGSFVSCIVRLRTVRLWHLSLVNLFFVLLGVQSCFV